MTKVTSFLGSTFGIIAVLVFPSSFVSIFMATNLVHILVGVFFIAVPLSLYFHMLAGRGQAHYVFWVILLLLGVSILSLG